MGFYLLASTTWNPPNLVDGGNTTTTVAVTGAELGDPVEVSMSASLGSAGNYCQLFGYVSATDVVTLVMHNSSGAAVNVGSGTVQIRVGKFA